MSIPRLAIRRPVAVFMLFLVVALVGAVALARLPIDLFPDISYPKLVIFTSYPGVAPAEVERLLTAPVEAEVVGVPGVEAVASVSRKGVSLVTLRFAWGTDMDFALLNVRERMDDLRDVIPATATRPSILLTDLENEPIMVLSVSGGSNLWKIKELAEFVIRRRLEQLDGVAQATVTGGLDREIQVQVDPDQLEAHGLKLRDVSRALASANVSAPGGTIRQGRYTYPLRTVGEFRRVAEIERVVVARQSMGGSLRIVRLEDVGTVFDGFAERESVAHLNGKEAVGLLLFKRADANTVLVADAIEEVILQLRTEYPSVRIDIATSHANFISVAINNLVREVIVGGCLAFLVLFLFLRDPRYPVIVCIAIPVSVMATLALMDVSKISLNMMSLGGLALGAGMFVDNSIVVLENISRHRELGTDAVEAAAVGAEEVTGAITASTLTTIGVFAPVVYMEGVAAELFKDLSITISYSLGASLLVALTVLPAWAARIDVRGSVPRSRGRCVAPLLKSFDRGFDRFARGYHSALEWSLDRPWRVLGAAAAALVVSLGAGLGLQRDLLPRVDQGAFEVRVRLPEGRSLESTTHAAGILEAVLLAEEGVKSVFSRIGRDPSAYGRGGEGVDLNSALLQVRVSSGHRTTAVMERVRPLLLVPGAVVTLQGGRTNTFGRLRGGEVADVTVRVRGENLEMAHARAEEAALRLAHVDRLANVRLGTEHRSTELHVEILRDRAASYGIDPLDVADAVGRGMRGDRATDFVDFDRKVPVVVRYPAKVRYSRSTLGALRVRGVPLRELVEVKEVAGLPEVHHADRSRVVMVLADVITGGVDQATVAVEDALRSLPPVQGLRTEVGGENEEMRRSFRGLGAAFVLALVFVYMVLAAQFESFGRPFTILMAVPLGVVGAVAALVSAGHGVNTMSLMGLVILIGIVSNDAILKVSFYDQARAVGSSVREAIIIGGRVRLRPVLMTTATTVLGLLPMALGVGSGAALQAPLALTVAGGFAVATVLTLVVIPVGYLLLERDRAGGEV